MNWVEALIELESSVEFNTNVELRSRLELVLWVGCSVVEAMD